MSMLDELKSIQGEYIKALSAYLSVHASRNEIIREAIAGGVGERDVMDVFGLGLGELEVILTGNDKHVLP